MTSLDNVIINYIQQYISLTEEESKIVNNQNLIRHFKKNDLLLSAGQYAKECYFVLNGCVRAYYLIDGEERNTSFFFENMSVRPVSYQNGLPSEYYLACLEDCVLAIGSNERNNFLVNRIPKLADLVSKMNEELFMQKTIELDYFKNQSPEERYLMLLEKQPEIINRVPLYHLASYLGITQISLSRIRSRISRK